MGCYRESHKYLFYNDSKEVLCFNTLEDDFKISFPKVYSDNVGTNIYEPIIDILKGNEIYLCRDDFLCERLVSVNNKLVPQKLINRTYFYSCYKVFSREELALIKKVSDKIGMEPHLIPMDLLIEMPYIKRRLIHLDKDNVEAMKLLRRKLNYEKY